MVRLRRLGVVILATAFACVAAEVAVRLLDGYRIMSVPLVAVQARTTAGSLSAKWLEADQAEPYVQSLPTAAGVDRSWFQLDPPLLSHATLAIDPALERRYWSHRQRETASLYEWNGRFLADAICERSAAADRVQTDALVGLDDFFSYQPQDRSAHPTYRFLRRTRHPSGLVTNGFGWRGAEVPLNKPAGRVRIAFVGASTTVDAHGDRFSYPEHINRWLDVWGEARHPGVTFDVVNAGREGITSRSIAAIVESELVPVRPDIVVYYEGSNEFWPNAFVARPLLRVARALGQSGATGRYSAIALRVQSAINARRTGAEPVKPPLPVDWPADLDEHAPPLGDPRLPLRLPEILGSLDRIRAALEPFGATLMPSSFVWLVHAGMELDRDRDAILYEYLNDGYWPFSYAHLRRFADFQNRVFAAYAAAHGLPFNDLAAVYPRDPRLFTDAIHMTAAGIKLKAWLVFQHLVPEIERRIADGRLPIADPGGRTSHPAFEPPTRLVRREEIRRECARTAASRLGPTNN